MDPLRVDASIAIQSPAVLARAEALGMSAERLEAVRLDLDDEVWRAWEALEAHAHGSPYQSAAIVRAWFQSGAGAEPWILGVRAEDGALRAVFPLEIKKVGGMRVAFPCLGSHASVHGGLVDRAIEPSITADWLQDTFNRLGREADVDAVCLARVPETWSGRPNPLADLPGRRSILGIPTTDLMPDFQAWQDNTVAVRHQKDMRRSKRVLERDHGPVRLVRAATAEQARQMVALFLEQKKAFFQQNGAPNSFAAIEIQRFLKTAASTGDRRLEMYTLYVGDAAAAVIGGIRSGGRFTTMLNAMARGPIERASPGLLIVYLALERFCGEGVQAFDLGIGEARYKSTFCKEIVPVREVALGITSRGKVFASGWLHALQAWAWAKQRPAVLRALNLLR